MHIEHTRKVPILILALLATIIIGALIAFYVNLNSSRPESNLPLAKTADKCATCHLRVTPAIVQQYALSNHALRDITCSECHVVEQDYPTGKEHEGSYVSSRVTPKKCARCHLTETQQYVRSRHGLPAWAALTGTKNFTPQQLSEYNGIEEIIERNTKENALYIIEGQNITKMACEGCHSIGKPNADGSTGNCNKCHLRHEFSLATVRKPETCSACHIGPDHPQWEIYQESYHGILYATQGERWNWELRSGRLTVKDFPAPTCATCHISGFGTAGTTHDVGERLSYFLFAEVSELRPSASENKARMKEVCTQCHSKGFVENEFQKADNVTASINEKVKEAKSIMENLTKSGIITDKPFDHPIKFTAFDLWHYYGRTAKFGAYMQGPDYTQWHGIYPLQRELEKIKKEAERLLFEKKGDK